MIYRITPASHPRLLLLFLLIILLPALGIAALIFLGGLLSIVILLAAAYFAYHLIRFTVSHLTSWIETSGPEIRCKTPTNELIRLPWAAISRAGYCRQEGSRPVIYLYNQEADRLVTIPREYGPFEHLRAEISGKIDFQEIRLSRGESLRERILKEEKP